MKTIKYYIITILTICLGLSSEIIDKTELKIKEFLPDHISLDWSMYKIDKQHIKSIQNTVRQKFFRKELNTWVIVDSDSSKYYAILDNVKGKSLPITFLAISIVFFGMLISCVPAFQAYRKGVSEGFVSI